MLGYESYEFGLLALCSPNLKDPQSVLSVTVIKLARCRRLKGILLKILGIAARPFVHVGACRLLDGSTLQTSLGLRFARCQDHHMFAKPRSWNFDF